MKIATVIPTFGPAPWLAETLRSLERQTLPPAEVVLVDDGSEPPVVRPATTLPLRLLRIPHAGIGAARNAGVRATTAPLIHICDHDDVVQSRFYERLEAVLASRPELDVVHSYLASMDADGSPRPGHFPISPPAYTSARATLRTLLHENTIGSVASIFTRRAYDRVGGFRNLHFGQDWDFWIRVAARGGRFALVPEELATHREHATKQYRSENRERVLEETVEMLRTVRVPAPARLHRARALGGARLQLALIALDRGGPGALRPALLALPARPKTAVRILSRIALNAGQASAP